MIEIAQVGLFRAGLRCLDAGQQLLAALRASDLLQGRLVLFDLFCDLCVSEPCHITGGCLIRPGRYGVIRLRFRGLGEGNLEVCGGLLDEIFARLVDLAFCFVCRDMHAAPFTSGHCRALAVARRAWRGHWFHEDFLLRGG